MERSKESKVNGRSGLCLYEEPDVSKWYTGWLADLMLMPSWARRTSCTCQSIKGNGDEKLENFHPPPQQNNVLGLQL